MSLKSIRFRPRRVAVRVAVIAMTMLTVLACDSHVAGVSATKDTAPHCAEQLPNGPPPPIQPTTITTLQQAYHCIFDRYFGGSTLDDRVLLRGALAGFMQKLERLGLDRADAVQPALSGDRDRDWKAFSAMYQRVTGQLPADPAMRQALAAAAMNGMVQSLHDNHVRWVHPEHPPASVPGDNYGLGITTSPAFGLAAAAPQEVMPPLFVTSVVGGPAAEQGLRPGDVIVSVNGAPPFVDGQLSVGAMNLLNQQYPQSQQVEVTLQRPADGRTWTVTMKPAVFQSTAGAPAIVTSKLLQGDVADVQLRGFAPNAADMVLQAISSLGHGRALRGLILDLRGNGGGTTVEVARLLGAFVHGKVLGYECDARGRCTASHTDDSVALLHLPLVVLTDRNCVSACDAFSSAVKDLHLGQLVGTRTAGIVSGPALAYLLDDNSLLGMPSKHALGADREIIDGIGVAPDYYLPMTPQDLSTGDDSDVAKALSLLGA